MRIGFPVVSRLNCWLAVHGDDLLRPCYCGGVSIEGIHTLGGSVAEWLACWTQAQKDLGSNRSRDTVG